METPLSALLGSHEKPALELSHFQRRVVGCCHHALALTPRYRHDQSRALSLQRLSPPSSLLWAPRTPSRHGGISPSAYTHRLCPTWAVEEGLPSSASGYTCVPSSIPRKRPAPPPVLGRSLLPSPRHDGLGHFPFRVLLSRGCKVHALAFGPQVRFPRARPYGLRRAFDAPLRRSDFSARPEPATRRSGPYRGGTSTRKSDAAPRPDGPGPASFKTHHALELTAPRGSAGSGAGDPRSGRSRPP